MVVDGKREMVNVIYGPCSSCEFNRLGMEPGNDGDRSRGWSDDQAIVAMLCCATAKPTTTEYSTQ